EDLWSVPERPPPTVTDGQDVYRLTIHPEQNPIDMESAVEQVAYFERKARPSFPRANLKLFGHEGQNAFRPSAGFRVLTALPVAV
ncbi:MAG TPA: hypothetical protein VEU94_04765, partial [Terriglobales bacterium]|nr:hypothetical protein [Terriglobales bacterium]